MVKSLIAFGCSFTYGDELVDPNIKLGETCSSSYNLAYRNRHCYAGIVANHYSLDFINLALPGGTLESMRYALYWAQQNYDLSETLLIAGLTQAHRNSYFDESLDVDPWVRHRHSTWLKSDQGNAWVSLDKMWQTLCQCKEWQKFNLYQTVQVFENAKTPLILLPVFAGEPDFDSQFKTDFVLRNLLSGEHYYNHGHPNETGHQIIAQRLIEYIDHAKLQV